MIYMGIDPGYTGGIATYNPEFHLLKTRIMPVIKTASKGRTRAKTIYDCETIKTIIQKTNPYQIIIEKQHLTAGDGKISNTSIVGGYNLLKGMAYMYLELDFDLIDVHPMTWHKTILGKARMKRDESKRLAEEKALALFPKHNFKRTPRCKTNHDGMIDAALLAYYGYLMEG